MGPEGGGTALEGGVGREKWVFFWFGNSLGPKQGEKWPQGPGSLSSQGRAYWQPEHTQNQDVPLSQALESDLCSQHSDGHQADHLICDSGIVTGPLGRPG